MPQDTRVVIVDDDEDILDLQRELLSDINVTPASFNDPAEAWEFIRRGDIQLVVSDWEMPGMSGMDLLFKIRGLDTPPHVIIVTGHGSVDRAVQAMVRGAFSFLQKPIQPDAYMECVKAGLEGPRQTDSFRPPTGAIPLRTAAVKPVAGSDQMKHVLDMGTSAAASPSTVLLLGESGTGKEVLADFIHTNSPRARGPIVKVNCGALPEHLMESELFGHEKGAFTGADKRRIGRFEQANGGTLFLDEIGDLMHSLQVKLLRALQDKVIERVGSGAPIPVDFRLICATHRDLNQAVKEGEFRQDLFYRINVIPIHVPPLRDRYADIGLMADRFFEEMRNALPNPPQRISPEARSLLQGYDWPGNVRQLRNAIEYAVVMCKEDEIGPSHLPLEIRSTEEGPSIPAQAAPSGEDDAAVLDRMFNAGTFQERVSAIEATIIRTALNRNDWNVKKTCRDLQISRSSIYERMKAYGINRE